MFLPLRTSRWNTRRGCFPVVTALLLTCGVSTAYCQTSLESRNMAAKYSLMIAPTYAFPAGDGFGGTDSHLGVRLTGNIPWADKLAFALTVQYQPLGVADSAEFDIQKYLGGFHYFDEVRPHLTIYGSYDIGAYRTSKLEILSTGLEERSSSTRLGMAGGVGVIYWATTTIGLDLSARIDETSFKQNATSASGYLVELHAGIRASL